MTVRWWLQLESSQKASLLLPQLGLSVRTRLSLWPGSPTVWGPGLKSETGCASCQFLKAWGWKQMWHLLATFFGQAGSETRFREEQPRAPLLHGRCIREFGAIFKNANTDLRVLSALCESSHLILTAMKAIL